jgi:hypothetical protein
VGVSETPCVEFLAFFLGDRITQWEEKTSLGIQLNQLLAISMIFISDCLNNNSTDSLFREYFGPRSVCGGTFSNQ